MSIQVPTGEQCDANAKVFEDEHTIGYAIWYPQMGGYSGKAVALIRKTIESPSVYMECFDVLVWHNGEFPFGERKDNPSRLHHCAPEQFIAFGEKVVTLMYAAREK